MARDTFRIALRSYGPFESAIARQWASFCAASGCTLRLEAPAFELHPLHETCFGREGLKRGTGTWPWS
jgi:multiple sugar transport system substrate-binding protein